MRHPSPPPSGAVPPRQSRALPGGTRLPRMARFFDIKINVGQQGAAAVQEPARPATSQNTPSTDERQDPYGSRRPIATNFIWYYSTPGSLASTSMRAGRQPRMRAGAATKRNRATQGVRENNPGITEILAIPGPDRLKRTPLEPIAGDVARAFGALPPPGKPRRPDCLPAWASGATRQRSRGGRLGPAC